MQKIEKEENFEDGRELLERVFSPGYFVLLRIPDSIELSPAQKQVLNELIEDRNHFGIREFVKKLNN